MHYVSLVAVDVPELEKEPETDALIEEAIKKISQEITNNESISSIVQRLHLGSLKARRTPFARKVDEAVCNAMEPYCENTEDPRYLEFWDKTEEAEDEYENGSTEMVRLSNGTFVSPYGKPFYDTFVVRDGKVYQRKAGPCAHEKRTKKAKKMRVMMRSFSKIYPTFKEYAEEHCGYTYDAGAKGYGYYVNPRSFWDWYQIGGRWPFELLVKADCEEYSPGERDEDYTAPKMPEGYRWVSAARKKDIAWDVMREWKENEAKKLFRELEKAFESGEVPEHCYGQIKENGIAGWGGMLYIKGESVDDYLKRRHPEINEKYCVHPYGFLDKDGWNTHETFIYQGTDSHFEQKDEWREQLNRYIENADDDTVLVIVDSHD